MRQLKKKRVGDAFIPKMEWDLAEQSRAVSQLSVLAWWWQSIPLQDIAVQKRPISAYTSP
jgi:hypothetical protein